jgi:hypothetical protein
LNVVVVVVAAKAAETQVMKGRFDVVAKAAEAAKGRKMVKGVNEVGGSEGGGGWYE